MPAHATLSGSFRSSRTARPSDTPAKLTRVQQAAMDLVAALPAMNIDELRALWPQYFSVAPFSIKRSVLAPCLAYRIQEEVFGGLSRSARARLDQIATAWGEGRIPSIAPGSKPKVRAGTRLLRSWGGKVHEVTVLEDGFLYREVTYSSLSEIARQITGAQWSGPLFFGLKKTMNRLQSQRNGKSEVKQSTAADVAAAVAMAAA